VIAAGGTAGHVVPALAVADALRASGAEVSFIGTREKAEAELVPAAGYEIDFLRVEGMSRSNPLRAARAISRSALAVPAARRALRARGAQAVLGGGGYVAAPAGLAALGMRLPLVLSEADRHLGLANRALASRARKVCLAFEIPGREGDRYRVTGRPVPAAIMQADRAAARARFGVVPEARCLLVFGGSLGALSINKAALEGLIEPEGREFHVLHITGRRDYGLAREALAAAGEPDRYTVVEWEPGLADALAACDLALARSGGSVFELAAAGVPAILVPYPYAAARHQHANAEWMTEAGAAVTIEDDELSGERVRALAAEILGDGERLARMSDASRSLARPGAASEIAAEILSAIPGEG
jgi:UDP-N-acetylglucosamine--N-acetylmuramyl-(pentapeptide) pyrophosphoryl-undecaprenol N-acetylglucosamine transferase